VEGRDQPKGRPHKEAQARTQSRKLLPLNLMRVNEAARRDRKVRFTASLHHVDVWALLRAFQRLKRGASPGVDGETVAHYE
jgi:RNA-directed DNA polymerase